VLYSSHPWGFPADLFIITFFFALSKEFFMNQQKKLQLLIADDHEVIRGGLKNLLANTDIKVVAAVATAEAAVKFVLENDVDVVLMDVRMLDGDGLTTLGRIKLDSIMDPENWTTKFAKLVM
jgi:CheY-like chemotaxis protein